MFPIEKQQGNLDQKIEKSGRVVWRNGEFKTLNFNTKKTIFSLAIDGVRSNRNFPKAFDVAL